MTDWFEIGLWATVLIVGWEIAKWLIRIAIIKLLPDPFMEDDVDCPIECSDSDEFDDTTN